MGLENMVNSAITQVIKTPTSRELAIRIAGKVFHILISGGNPSLAVTANQYREKTGLAIEIDDISQKAIDTFKNSKSGIMIAGHESGIVSDHFPIFQPLGDSLLQSTEFYTGAHNLKMNKQEFPCYSFSNANLSIDEETQQRKQKRELKEWQMIRKDEAQRKMDKAQITGEKGNLEGETKTEQVGETKKEEAVAIKHGAQFQKTEKPFQFWMDFKNSNGFLTGSKRLITDDTPDDTPVLLFQLEHDGAKGYTQIAKSLISGKGLGKTKIHARIVYARDLKGKSGEEKRAFWDAQFANTPPAPVPDTKGS